MWDIVPHSIKDIRMDFKQYSLEFTAKALSAEYTQQDIDRCLEYAHKLFLSDLPVIYNTQHLSLLVGYKKRYLKRAVTYTNYYYRDFTIIKKNGKPREISEPLPSLKEIQNWILENILYKITVSPFAKAYKPEVTIIENLKFHKNQPIVYTIDLKNFFSSIKIESVENIFRKMGYSKIISNLLAKLCCRERSLPQGAPTSPCLSNIYLIEFDKLISNYCLINHIRYTRYADDLTFSGNFDVKELNEFVINVIKNHRLTINDDKTKIMTKSNRQSVTGIVVNEKLQVVFHKRNQLRQELYYIKKFGFQNHSDFKKIKQKNYLEHLLGKVNFILHVNPKDKEFIDYKTYLIDLKKAKDKYS